MSSSTPAILDHEVLESDHNEYEIPQAHKDFLSNDRHTFVSIEITKDVNKLVCNYGFNVSNARDLRSLANNASLKVPQDCGLMVLAEPILGWKMEKRKRVTMSQ
ncbi:hypothetical protein NL676_036986 [Syzygium grande]|nr:hypothetical protein NL676_036986 [Syzygium grande]